MSSHKTPHEPPTTPEPAPAAPSEPAAPPPEILTTRAIREGHLTRGDVHARGIEALPPESKTLVANAEAEYQQTLALKPVPRSTLARDAVRLKIGGIGAAVEVAAAHLDPAAPEELPGFLYLIEDARLGYVDAVKAYGNAPTGVQIYSAAAKDHAALVLVEVNDFKGKVTERVPGHTAAEKEVRTRAGIGESATADLCGDVARIANGQLDLLADTASLELLDRKGVYPERSLARLAPLTRQLDDDLDAGIGTDPRRGAAATKVNNALLKIQIVLSRVTVFLREFGAKDQADLIDIQIPKRFHRRATDPKTPNDNPQPPNDNPQPAPASEAAGEKGEKKAEPATGQRGGAGAEAKGAQQDEKGKTKE